MRVTSRIMTICSSTFVIREKEGDDSGNSGDDSGGKVYKIMVHSPSQ